MNYIPNILKTNTKENDHTLVRKWYLQDQIIAMDDQIREYHKIGSMDLFNDIAAHSFVNVLESLRRKYKDELDNWNDKTDEYNS